VVEIAKNPGIQPIDVHRELTGSVILKTDCSAFSITPSSGDETHLSGTV